MAVQDGPTFKRYAANGVTTAFPIPFLLLEAGDLVVTLNDVPVTSGFTLTGVGSPSSTATFSVAPTGDLLFRLVVPFQRLFDYQENGDFLAETINGDFDRIWQALKEIRRDVGRALLVPPTEAEGISNLPEVSERALKLLSFDEDGNPVAVAAAEQSATGLAFELSDKNNSNKGAALIGFRGRTLPVVLDEYSINILDYIPAAEHAAIRLGTSTYDCSPAFQAVEDIQLVSRKLIIYPSGVYVIKSAITYAAGSNHIGVWAGTVIKMDGAFANGFTPKAGGPLVQNPSFRDLTFIDAQASNSGRGTTSTKRAIDLTGTYRAEVSRCKGVGVDVLVGADIGPSGVHQHTKLSKIKELEVSNVNWVCRFPPTAENRFPYGDLEIYDTLTAGSCAYGVQVEDTDGLMYRGNTMFSTGSLTCSGNYINISNSQQFEPRAPDLLTISPNCIRVKQRSGGSSSKWLTIAGVSAAVAGRPADASTTGAAAILLEKVSGFNVSVTVNDPSYECLRAENCDTGIVNIVAVNANSQNIEFPKPINTYDGVFLGNCRNVAVYGVIYGPAQRNAVFMDDSCVGCFASGVFRGGSPGGVRTPNTGSNSWQMVSDGNSALRGSGNALSSLVYSGGETTPNVFGRNDVTVVFSNSSPTAVTDLSGSLQYAKITVLLQDNSTTLRSHLNGGNFVFKIAADNTNNVVGVNKGFTFVRGFQSNRWVEV